MPISRDPISHEPADARAKAEPVLPVISEEDYEVRAIDPPTEIQDKRYTVLYGFGRVHTAKKFYLDEVEFTGGVARHVSQAVVDRWNGKSKDQQGNIRPSSVKVTVLPDDADVLAYAKSVGIKPMDPAKLAMLLSVADYDQLVSALGHARTQELMEELDKRLAQKRGR